MKPFFGSGFGLADSQFGVALGTKITGGPLGATITKLVIDSPFNIAGNQGSLNWRLLVLKGDMNPDILKILDNDFQLATNGWPRKGGSDLSLPILFEKIIGNQTNINNYASAKTDQIGYDLGDEGPNVGSQEVMTAFVTPLFNATGVPGYGLNNFSFVNFSVFGKYSRSLDV